MRVVIEKIEEGREWWEGEKVFVGIEGSGDQQEDMVGMLREEGYCVEIVNGGSSDEEGKEDVSYRKRDEIEVQVIGEGLVGKKGRNWKVGCGVYKEVENVSRGRGSEMNKG